AGLYDLEATLTWLVLDCNLRPSRPSHGPAMSALASPTPPSSRTLPLRPPHHQSLIPPAPNLLDTQRAEISACYPKTPTYHYPHNEHEHSRSELVLQDPNLSF